MTSEQGGAIANRQGNILEQQVRQAVQNGLDARIYRVGRLVGRASDGVFQKNPEQVYTQLMNALFGPQ